MLYCKSCTWGKVLLIIIIIQALGLGVCNIKHLCIDGTIHKYHLFDHMDYRIFSSINFSRYIMHHSRDTLFNQYVYHMGYKF